MSVDKRTLRRDLRARRKQLAATEVAAAGRAVCARLRALPAFQAAAAIVAYLDNENEVPTTATIEAIVASGRPLYLPRGDGAPALTCWRPGDPLIDGPAGIRQPAEPGTTTLPLPAVAVVPLVAWDATGTRLGRGGGFYDRLFERLDSGVVRVGLGYEFQEVPDLPREPWDVALHYVITERRVVTCEVLPADHDASLQKGGLEL